jgi:crotonobetainyl-CoA:carnitine CoA-transferase CaiB-like acyl-CoA transferase
LSLNRGRDGAPTIPGLAVSDVVSATMTLSGVLMALLRRKETGRGDYLDMSMAECLLASIPNNLGVAMAAGRQPDLSAERSLGGNALYMIYETKDGDWIALAGQEPKFVANLLKPLGRPDLIELCELPPGKGQDPVREFLRATFRTKTKQEWVEYFKGRDVPFAPVNTLPEVLKDPHFRERGIVMTDARGWDHIRNPIRFTHEPARERLDPPALGQHSQAILRGLGYAESEIARLSEEGVIKQATQEDIARHAGSDGQASAAKP